jgi:hypothetical protein
MQLGGNAGCQGIGGAYTAGLAENFLPEGTAPQDVQAAVDVFNKCNTQCPQAKIVAGGYRYDWAVNFCRNGNLRSSDDPLVREVLSSMVQSRR